MSARQTGRFVLAKAPYGSESPVFFCPNLYNTPRSGESPHKPPQLCRRDVSPRWRRPMQHPSVRVHPDPPPVQEAAGKTAGGRTIMAHP